MRALNSSICLATAAFVLVGCKQALPVVPLVPASITIVQGNLQSVQAGMDLPTAVVLRVTDATGVGLPNLTVALTIGLGGGTVTPASATTDAKGEVKAKWTLGPGIAAQTMLAAVPGVSPVTIFATGLLPTDIIIAQGNNQSGKVGQSLPVPIVVRVVASGNVAMVGVPVAFQITAGGGALAPQSILTNALGEATVKWTMGLQPGGNTAIVSASSLSPVTLTASATP